MKTLKIQFQVILFVLLVSAVGQFDALAIDIPISGTDTISGEHVYLFDNGGASDNYVDNADGSIVIFPPANEIRTVIQFNSFSLAAGDTLLIYDGPLSASLLIGKYVTNPGTIKSNDTTGILTIRLTTDSIENSLGFSATILYEAKGSGADLILHDISLSKDSVAPNEYFNVEYSISNQGSVDANKAVVGFYISEDEILDHNDIYIKTMGYYYLDAGLTDNGYDNFKITKFPSWGNMYLLITIDHYNETYEINELNNVTPVPFYLSEPTKDFRVTSLNSSDLRIIKDINNRIRYYIRNEGNSIADTVISELYISSDGILSDEDIFLSKTTFKSIKPNLNYYSNTNIDRSSIEDLSPGIYYLIGISDSDNRWKEINEDNNERVTPVLVVDGDFDFVLEEIYLSSNSIADDSYFKVGIQASFQGSWDVGSNYIGFYLSEDDILDESDTLISNFSLGSFSNGDEFSDYRLLKLPQGTSHGGHYLISVLDYNDYVAESTESNNIKVNLLSVENSNNDLLAEYPFIAPDTIYHNINVSISVVATNIGNTMNYSAPYGIYISTDSIYDAGDIPIYTSYIYSLCPGETESRELNIRVTNSILPGSYYFIYHIDADNTIAETNEENNFISNSVELMPEPSSDFYNLAVTSLSIDSGDFMPGGVISINLSCVNKGTDIKNTHVHYRLYLSNDSAFDVSDLSRVLYGSYSSTWYSGNVRNIERSLILPDSLGIGKYYLVAKIDANNLVFEENEADNIAIVPFVVTQPVYDIQSGTISCDGTVVSGNSLNVRTEIYNNCPKEMMDINLGYYLSTDADYDTSDIYIDYEKISYVSANSSRSITSNINVPSEIDSGIYFLLTFVDYQNNFDETDEYNNITSIPIGVLNPDIDLSVQKLSVQGSIFSVGEIVSANFTIWNEGYTEANSIPVACFLSEDQSFNSISDRLLCDLVIPSVQSFSNYTSNMSFFLSADNDTGDYFLLFIIDPENKIDENNEENNQVAYSFKIAPGTVELEIRDPYASIDSIAKDNNLSLGCYVFNNGTKNVSDAKIGYFLSTDTIYSADDLLLGSSNLNINRGAYYYDSYTVNISETDTGKYYLLFFTDYNEVIDEANENDNLDWLSLIVVPSVIDLSISNASISNASSLPYGNQVTIDYTLVNNGSTRSQSSHTGFYLSVDSILNPLEDAYLAYDYNYGLDPNSSITDSKSISVPVTIPPGQYWIIAKANYDHDITETNYLNNEFQFMITVTTPYVDIIISETTIQNEYIVPGQSFHISCHVLNTGNIQTPSTSRLEYYMSTDSLYDNNDIFLGADYCDRINPGAYTYESINASIPINLTEYEYYMLFVSDFYNSVDEINEENNVAFEKVLVEKPFYNINISGLSLDGEYNDQTGGRYQINYTIHNSGSDNIYDLLNGIYLSTDSLSESDHQLLKHDSILYLPAGISINISSDVYIPANSAINYGYLVVHADYTENIPESNETDNYAALAIATTGDHKPDLITEILNYESDSISPGEVIIFSCSISNTGNYASPDTKLNLYISSDTILDDDDEKISIEFVNGLYINQSLVVNGSFQFPYNKQPGWYYLIFSVDTENNIEEFNEDNNIAIYLVYFNNHILDISDDKIDEIILYPNPSASVINFTCMNNFSTYRIITEKGDLEEIGHINQGVNSIHIDKLKPGEYFLIMQSENRFISRKFTVIK